MNEQEEYIKGLEDENRFMADLLQRMAKRIGELTDQRNRYWRETVELKKAAR